MRLIRRVRPLLEYPFVQFQVFTTKTNCSKYVVTSENILAKKIPVQSPRQKRHKVIATVRVPL